MKNFNSSVRYFLMVFVSCMSLCTPEMKYSFSYSIINKTQHDIVYKIDYNDGFSFGSFSPDHNAYAFQKTSSRIKTSSNPVVSLRGFKMKNSDDVINAPYKINLSQEHNVEIEISEVNNMVQVRTIS